MEEKKYRLVSVTDKKGNQRDDIYNRICQFRIVEKQPELQFEEVEALNNEDRGGHGSTGKQ